MPLPKVRPDAADPWIEFRGFTLATQLPEGQMIEAHIALEDACKELEQAKDNLSALDRSWGRSPDPNLNRSPPLRRARQNIDEALDKLGCSPPHARRAYWKPSPPSRAVKKQQKKMERMRADSPKKYFALMKRIYQRRDGPGGTDARHAPL